MKEKQEKCRLSAFPLFPHNVSISYLPLGCQPFPKQALLFTCLQYKSFENTVGKGKIAHSEQFLLFP